MPQKGDEICLIQWKFNPMEVVKFIVPGNPMPWQRARQNYKTGSFFDSGRQAEYKARVRVCAMNAFQSGKKDDFPLLCGLGMNVHFYFKRPQGRLRKTESDKEFKPFRPDLDNCLKMIGDALNGVVWKDDAQIVSINATKLYHETGGIPRAEIEIYEIV